MQEYHRDIQTTRLFFSKSISLDSSELFAKHRLNTLFILSLTLPLVDSPLLGKKNIDSLFLHIFIHFFFHRIKQKKHLSLSLSPHFSHMDSVFKRETLTDSFQSTKRIGQRHHYQSPSPGKEGCVRRRRGCFHNGGGGGESCRRRCKKKRHREIGFTRWLIGSRLKRGFV